MPEPRRSIALIPYRANGRRILVLKRIPEKGNGWQPVTGRVDDGDGAAASRVPLVAVPDAPPLPDRDRVIAAALRELEEETSITDVRTLVDLGLETRFTGYDGHAYAERALAAEVPEDAEVRVSDEHEAARWVDADEAGDVLTWPENRKALQRLLDHLGGRAAGQK